MTKAKDSIENKNEIRILRWEKSNPVSQEEAEARLHQEGYHSFCWYDVPGAKYPRHRHSYDECLWILRGEIHFCIYDQTHHLKSGDRIYLPAQTPHTSQVPDSQQGVTYLVGQKAG
jgi:mannose-6-phosphate isomerase-like protein (cupin superfamily)